jgi:hypothetical protein
MAQQGRQLPKSLLLNSQSMCRQRPLVLSSLHMEAASLGKRAHVHWRRPEIVSLCTSTWMESSRTILPQTSR